MGELQPADVREIPGDGGAHQETGGEGGPAPHQTAAAAGVETGVETTQIKFHVFFKFSLVPVCQLALLFKKDA